MAEFREPFDCYGPELPQTPIVISVPHAGRDYPRWLIDRARVPEAVLRRLEDRFADRLVEPLILKGCNVVIARAPRAMIDLNRQEREIDPGMISGLPHDFALRSSPKVQGGLGLFPRRLQGVGELWHRAIDWPEAMRRIETIHRPYHAALAEMLQRARRAFGYAILLDIHSMPRLEVGQRADPPRIVLGDRFGQSASSRLMATAEALFEAADYRTVQNHPYPGNHLIERHGKPAEGRHALQIEIDRTLYVDFALDAPSEGMADIQALIVKLVNTLGSGWIDPGFAEAAE